MSYQRGDAVWAPDPFKSGENPPPWLILNNDDHPFVEEEYMVVTLTTTPHDAAVAIEDSDWVEGGMPRQSYASPWSIASPKHAALVRRQGRLEEGFVQTVVDEMMIYLKPPGDGSKSARSVADSLTTSPSFESPRPLDVPRRARVCLAGSRSLRSRETRGAPRACGAWRASASALAAVRSLRSRTRRRGTTEAATLFPSPPGRRFVWCGAVETLNG